LNAVIVFTSKCNDAIENYIMLNIKEVKKQAYRGNEWPITTQVDMPQVFGTYRKQKYAQTVSCKECKHTNN